MLEPHRHAPRGLGHGIADETFLEHAGIVPELAERWRGELDESLLDPATLEFARSLGVETASRRGGQGAA
jgi:hypothetical protein